MLRHAKVGEVITCKHLSQAGTNTAYRLTRLTGNLAYLGEEITMENEQPGSEVVHTHSFLCLQAGGAEIQFAYFRGKSIIYDNVFPIIVENSEQESDKIIGGFSEHRAITPEEKKLFEEVVCLKGAKYTPIVVSEQIVYGKNLRFFCLQESVTNPPVFKFVYVTIYVPHEGKPEITSIVDF